MSNQELVDSATFTLDTTRQDIVNWTCLFVDGSSVCIEAADEAAARAGIITWLDNQEPASPSEDLAAKIDALTAKLVEKGTLTQKDVDDIAVAATVDVGAIEVTP